MLTCVITSAETNNEYKNIEKVTLPAVHGQMQVLTDHAEAFVLLEAGKVILQSKGGSQQQVDIDSGGCYINNNKVLVII